MISILSEEIEDHIGKLKHLRKIKPIKKAEKKVTKKLKKSIQINK